MSIIVHKVNDLQIGQRREDGYINLTKMAQASGKLIADYLRLDTTNAFLSMLSTDMGIPISGKNGLVQVHKGGNNKAAQGTWGSPQVAIHCGQWCSPQFAVLVSKWVFNWITTSQNPVKETSSRSNEFFDAFKAYIEGSQSLNRTIHTAIHQQTDLLRACLKVLDTKLESLLARTLENGEYEFSIEEGLLTEKLVELTEVQIASEELEEKQALSISLLEDLQQEDLNSSATKQENQLSEAEEILKLKAEIEELRSNGSNELEAQLKELRKQLQAQTGILSIPIEQIEPNPEQPRQTFLPESVESMSRSLLNDGQLQPIILIQREKLLLFDGERRWRSAKALGWKSLQAVIIPEPESLHRKALLTSLHREDLNPLDKAEAILREVANNTKLDISDIPRILSTVVRRLNSQKRMNVIAQLITEAPEKQQQELAGLDLSDSEQAVLLVLLNLQLNPASVDVNIFPMLSLHDDLKVAICSGLKGMHAMALQKLSAKNLGVSEEQAHAVRAEMTKKVVEENLSGIATRKLVGEVMVNQTDGTEIDHARNLVSLEVRRLQKLSFDTLKKAERSQLLELQDALRQKLAEIEKILKDTE